MAPRKQHTLSEIQLSLQNRLSQSPFWSAAELTAFANDGIRTWSCLTGQWKQRVVLKTARFNPYCPLPSTITFGMHVEFNGVPMTQSSVENWDRGYPRWEADWGTPTEWAVVGINTIAVRQPDGAGSNSLAIDGVSAAPVLVNGDDFIDMSEGDFSAYIGYLQYLAAFKEGGAEFESSIPLYQAFLKQAAVQNTMLLASSKFRRAMGIDQDAAGTSPRMSKAPSNPVGMR